MVVNRINFVLHATHPHMNPKIIANKTKSVNLPGKSWETLLGVHNAKGQTRLKMRKSVYARMRELPVIGEQYENRFPLPPFTVSPSPDPTRLTALQPLPQFNISPIHHLFSKSVIASRTDM